MNEETGSEGQMEKTPIICRSPNRRAEKESMEGYGEIFRGVVLRPEADRGTGQNRETLKNKAGLKKKKEQSRFEPIMGDAVRH